MEEYTKSVKAALYERAKTPFTGTFILSWIICNWKFLVSLFFISEEHLKKGITRIEYIENKGLLEISNLFWKPLLLTIGGLFFFSVFNYITLHFLKFWKNLQFEKVDKKINIDANDYGTLLDQLRNREDTFANQIDSLNKERATLFSENEGRKDIVERLGKENERLYAQIEELKSITDSLKEESKIHEITINFAYLILNEYSRKFGVIKKDKSAKSIINKAPSPPSTEEKMNYIKNQYLKYLGNEKQQ
jgi:hypothetical protein